MRQTQAMCAFMLAVSTAAGQQFLSPTPGTRSNPNDLCNLEGVVVKSTTGEGLKKISVNLMALEGDHQVASAVTDETGRFAFTGVLPGRYAMAAGGNGYPQQSLGQKRGHPAGKVLTLAPGLVEKGLIFRLTPPGVITGTVRDEDGDPVIGGQVQALRIVHAGGRPQAVYAGAGQTNDLGEYRIYGLEPGQYFISASFQRQMITGGGAADDVYLPTFHPSTSDLGQAAPIQVAPGDEASGIDVDLEFVHAVTVHGRVVSETAAKVLRGTWVSMMPRDALRGGYTAAGYGAGVHDDSGDFEIHGVPPGAYVLFAGLNDAGQFYSGRAALEVGSTNVDGVTVTVGAGVALPGRIHLSPGPQLDPSRLVVSLQPIENFGGGASARVGPDGTFSLENLSDGTYRVNVGGFPEEFYLASARYGAAEALETGIAVSHRDPPGGLEVVLSADGGRVDGVVLKDHQTVGAAMVVLVPDPPNRERLELYSVKASDSLGRFSMLGLPPGDFKLFAWQQRDGVNYTDPDFFADYEDLGLHVHITEKEQQAVQLQVISDDGTQ